MATSPIDEAKELQQMLVTYAKQETVEPLKTLGKYIGVGLAGAMLIGLGGIFLGLGALRLAQAEVSDSSSWGSVGTYAIGLAVLVLLMGILGLLMKRAIKKVNP